MTRKAWIIGHSIVSPLGSSTEENYTFVREGISGLARVNDSSLSSDPVFVGKVTTVSEEGDLSKFESLCRQVLEQLVAAKNFDPAKTLLILSTTKGNIAFLEQGKLDHPRLHLHATAAFLAEMFGFRNHTVISNACISGVMALMVGKRMIEHGRYPNVVVVGADVLSGFVISGFQSLQALSPEMCKPFDANRKGINLGECAAGIVLSVNPSDAKENIRIAGGGLSNDANHISGPSRTGEELAQAISQALNEAKVSTDQIDAISAHGTATLYNDEMEAKAFNLVNLGKVPVNSLKGYYGHTLGAAGVLETILSVQSMTENELLATLGFETSGVSQGLNITKELRQQQLTTYLKTASGFGGCNAAMVLKKETKFES